VNFFSHHLHPTSLSFEYMGENSINDPAQFTVVQNVTSLEKGIISNKLSFPDATQLTLWGLK